MFLIIFFIGAIMTTVSTSDPGPPSEVVVLRAVRGRDARLPCGQGKVFLDGPDSYVLWLKNDRDFVYRFPNEDSERRSPLINRIFETACEADSCNDETSLLLKRVSDDDDGLYRCRIHYQASSSVDYVVDVRLVASPGTPRISDEEGKEITKGYLGPIGQGTDFSLICEVDVDQSDTLVYWRRNGALVERAYFARPGVLRSEVSVLNASRSDLDAHYECLAQNADVTEPLVASVIVKMYLPPLSVEIRLNNNVDFEAGQPRVVDCVVVGCVPPPTVTWHLGDMLLRPSVHKELHDGNYTVSSLTLAPSLRDNRSVLTCRAHNTHLPLATFEDKVTLNIGYRPTCLGNLEETIGVVYGEAETVTCLVESSPEPFQYSWTFINSRILYTSVKKVAGHLNRYSSTLTWLPREGDEGLLLCRATNAFGEQKRACSYFLVPGRAPNTPECIVLRSYPNNLRVQCKKGWDGGRIQSVHLEVFDDAGTLIQNLTEVSGHFRLNEGEKERNLSAVVYASNSLGRSDTKTLYLESMSSLVASAVTEDSTQYWTQCLQAGAGIVTLAVFAVMIIICVKSVHARRQVQESHPDLVPRSDGSFHREPDFVREERILGTTNITVNQLASTCPNKYPASPMPSSCRVLVGCAHSDSLAASAQPLASYYV